MAGRAALALASLVAIVGAGVSCPSREGQIYFVPYPDADPDVGPADAGCDADTCADAAARCDGDACGEAPCRESSVWLGHEELLGLLEGDAESLLVVDVRPVERCEAGRIPGARCVPWDGARFVASLDVPDGQGWLVLYDENGEAVADAARATVPSFCTRRVAALVDGMAAWEAAGLPIELD